MLSAGRRRSGFEATRIDFASALCVSSGLFFTLSHIETYVIDNVLSVKSTITLHSTAHSNHTSYKNLLHAPMFTLTVKMSLQMFYSNVMAHMPSAYGLGKNIIFNKVQFSSFQFRNMLFVLLMNFKMPTIVGVLKFMTRTNSYSSELSMKTVLKPHDQAPRF